VRRGAAGDDESVHGFAARRIGAEAAETLIDALVSGIWAGDARRLSLKATFPKMAEMEREHGGLFRAMRAKRAEAQPTGGPGGPAGTLTSFRSGMQALTDALADRLGDRLRLGVEVRSISDLGLRGFRILLDQGAPLETDAVVLATPTFVSADLLRETDAQLADILDEIHYTSLAVVHLGFANETLEPGPRGFGFLAPRKEGLRSLGCLWPSDIFDGRAPSGLRLTTTMIGGAHDEQAVELGDAALSDIARQDLRRAMGFVVAPRFKYVLRQRRAIPQYTLGHLDRLAAIDAALAQRPGLFIGGNGLRGLSVNLCIEEAVSTAEQLLEHLLQVDAERSAEQGR
jgi:oxygen-dependent protoporphyrinogen oxidase